MSTIRAKIYFLGQKGHIKTVTMLSNIKSAEILTFLKFSKNIDIGNRNSILITRPDKRYHFLLPDEDLSRYDTGSTIDIYLCEPKFRIIFNLPDESTKMCEFETQTPVGEILKKLCLEICQFSECEPWSLFLDGTDTYGPNASPLPIRQCVYEASPTITKLTLRRRFWTNEVKKAFKTEPDIHFSYMQVCKSIFNPYFERVGDLPLLTAIYLIVYFKSSGPAIDLLNGSKSKMQNYVPEVVIKDRSLRKQTIESINQYSDGTLESLKFAFLQKLLEDKTFLCPEFPYKDGSQHGKQMTFQWTPTMVYLREVTKKGNKVVASFPPMHLRTMKQVHHVFRFDYIVYKETPTKKEGYQNKTVEAYMDSSNMAHDVFDFVTGFSIYIKKFKDSVKASSASSKKKTSSSSKRMPSLKIDDHIITPPDFAGMPNTDLDNVDPPIPQILPSTKIPLLAIESDEFHEETHKGEIEWSLPVYDLEKSRSLIQRIESAFNDVLRMPGTTFCDNLPDVSLLLSTAIQQFKESNGDQNTVACAFEILTKYSMDNLPSLDQAYIQIRMHQLIKGFTRRSYSRYDFINNADAQGSEYGNLLRSLLKPHRGITEELAHFIFQTLNCHEFLPLTSAILHSISMTGVSIAHSLFEAGFSRRKLLPIITTHVNTSAYDPILLDTLARELPSIVSKHKNTLLSLPHSSPITIKMIESAVEELEEVSGLINSQGIQFLQRHSQFLTDPALSFSATYFDAARSFQVSRETSFLLWRMGYMAMSQALAEAGSLYAELFAAEISDHSLHDRQKEAFEELTKRQKEASDLLKSMQGIDSIDSPIIQWLFQNDPADAYNYLALESLSERHKQRALRECFDHVDRQLQLGRLDSNGQKEFRQFTFLASILSRNAEANKKLVSITNNVANALSDSIIGDERIAKFMEIRREMKPFLELHSCNDEDWNEKEIDISMHETDCSQEINELKLINDLMGNFTPL